MPASTYSLTMPGAMLERGFWLYVWRIASPIGELLYVGRTGDSASPNASPPFMRMGQESICRKTGLHIREEAQQGPKLRLPAIFDRVAHRIGDDDVVGEDLHIKDGRVRSAAERRSVAHLFVRRI